MEDVLKVVVARLEAAIRLGMEEKLVVLQDSRILHRNCQGHKLDMRIHVALENIENVVETLKNARDGAPMLKIESLKGRL